MLAKLGTFLWGYCWAGCVLIMRRRKFHSVDESTGGSYLLHNMHTKPAPLPSHNIKSADQHKHERHRQPTSNIKTPIIFSTSKKRGKMHSLSSGLSLLLLVISSNVHGALSFVSPPHGKASNPKSKLLYKSSDSTLPPSLRTKTLPKIIQGGMGVRISSWKLAREVSRRGEMGVISGTAMDIIFVRTLQDGKHWYLQFFAWIYDALLTTKLILFLHWTGDPGGHFRRALATFPNQAIAQQALDKYFIPEGKAPTKPYRSLPLWALSPPRQLEEATILGNYCEVWLAKHNDDGRWVMYSDTCS